VADPGAAATAPRGSRRARAVAAPLATLAAGTVCAVVAGAQLGSRGVLSAVLATAVVACFFWSGLVPLLVAQGQQGKAFGLVVLLLNYVLRLVLVLVVLRVAAGVGAVDAGAVGLSVVVCALVWSSAQAVLLARV